MVPYPLHPILKKKKSSAPPLRSGSIAALLVHSAGEASILILCPQIMRLYPAPSMRGLSPAPSAVSHPPASARSRGASQLLHGAEPEMGLATAGLEAVWRSWSWVPSSRSPSRTSCAARLLHDPRHPSPSSAAAAPIELGSILSLSRRC
jgi:hypothetical protein